MQITWLFGNGFDLSFGLKTSYFDFYEYLLNNEKIFSLEKNIIFQQLKKDGQDNKFEDWADYESKLGKLTNELSVSDVTMFMDSKLELDDLLKSYLDEATQLEEAESKIKLQSQEVVNIIKKSILNITALSKRVDVEKVENKMNSNRQEHVYLNAISFNYTKTVSLFWRDVPEEYRNLKFFGKYPSNTSIVRLISPFYIHGTLENDEMIIGVNDETQIINSEYSSNPSVHEMLIKNKILEIAGQRNFETFQRIVKNTSIFCLYGLSIGSTDKEYWKLIKKQLLNSDSLLIIYAFKKSVPQGITRKHNALKAIKHLFYQSSDASEEEISKIDERIIVEINANIFGNLSRKED